MKVVILAGGLGTRISEETQVRPKPMVEIGGMPILWHIMKIYSHFGFNDFVICLGYKGDYIKQWFMEYRTRRSDLTIDFATAGVKFHDPKVEPWRVSLVDTGPETMTGGRIARIRHLIGDEPFMVTYGDGVSDVDIGKLLELHKSHGKIATVTSVIPAGRFGAMEISDSGQVLAFSEKTDNGKRVNGGFFVFQPQVFDYIKDGDATIFEKGPLESLASAGELVSYGHEGFWHPMDTLSDKQKLEAMWSSGAPWNFWEK
jgi:glucose-1-phosphate cytidylyltransferase